MYESSLPRLKEGVGLYFPDVLEEAVEIRAISHDELFVKTESGACYLYDDLENSIRGLPRDMDNMTEEECSREFGKRLKRMLFQKGVTQNQLAEKTGISSVSLSQYINGKKSPGFYNLDKIARALECSLDELRYL
jgi:DNA-binding Xre family transcriptional regulator